MRVDAGADPSEKALAAGAARAFGGGDTLVCR